MLLRELDRGKVVVDFGDGRKRAAAVRAEEPAVCAHEQSV
jgi:hypothetical protein